MEEKQEGDPRILGKWKSVKFVNYNAYLAAIGVNFLQRKLIEKLTTHLDIKKEGEEWVWKLILLTLYTEVSRFTLDKPFEESSPLTKEKITSLVTIKDGKMVWTMNSDPVVISVYYMEDDDTLISVDTVGDIEMKVTYTRTK